MQSMTGFSRASGENEHLRAEVSIRTVNHRHLDITVRVPEGLREYESMVRKAVAERLTRGRAEVRIDVLDLHGSEPEYEVDEVAVQNLRAKIDELAGKGLIASDLSFADLLKVPGALRASSNSSELRTEEVDLLGQTVEKALQGVVEARRSEGRNLQAALEGLCEELGEIVGIVEVGWQEKAAELPDTLRSRINEVLEGNVGLDETRLAQEVAILAERGDVREELDRLRSHLDHFRGLLEEEGQAVGKRLDFLAQEIFRELSTLAAKLRDPEAVQRVIDGKLVCEQIREQVQNIE